MPRLGGNRLPGQEFMQFRDALVDAFGLQSFDEMLLFQLNRRRDILTLAGAFGTIVYDVISKAEEQGWTAELLQAARISRPENKPLIDFALPFGLVPDLYLVRDSAPATEPITTRLEREVRKANQSIDPVFWTEQLGKLEGCVCRIVITAGGKRTYGTGFLIGADRVITNYHVLEKVISGDVVPERVTFTFDYKMLKDGTTLNAGTVHRLAPGRTPEASDYWLVDYSKYSELDEKEDAETGGAEPSDDELDYAVIRLAQKAGAEKLGGATQADPNAPTRGWISLPTDAYAFERDTALFIFQHPEGLPLKLALDTYSILGMNQKGNRVRYRTNTEKGSSGSPCFDANWQLVALHHGGDPNFTQIARYNQGIPIQAIVNRLNEQEKLS